MDFSLRQNSKGLAFTFTSASKMFRKRGVKRNVGAALHLYTGIYYVKGRGKERRWSILPRHDCDGAWPAVPVWGDPG